MPGIALASQSLTRGTSIPTTSVADSEAIERAQHQGAVLDVRRIAAVSDVLAREVHHPVLGDVVVEATATGEELWKVKTPSTGNSVPMSYTYRGQQYVVIAAGGHFVSPAPAGDYILAYKLAPQT